MLATRFRPGPLPGYRFSHATQLLGRALLLTLITVVAACGTPVAKLPPLRLSDGRPVQTPKPAQITPEDEPRARALAAEAQRLSRRGQTGEAERRIEDLLAHYLHTQTAKAVLTSRAQLAMTAGRPEEAVQRFEQLLAAHGEAPEASAWREAYATQLVQIGRLDDARALLRHLYATAPSTAAKLRLGQSLSDALVRAEAGAEACELEMELVHLPGQTPARTQELTEHLQNLVLTHLCQNDLEQLYRAHEKEAAWEALNPTIAFRLAKIYYHVRDYSRAESVLASMTSRYPTNNYAAMAQDFARLIKARFEVNTGAVGVVLPLSGKFKQYGERSLRAIELALRRTPHLQLVVKDSEGDASKAAQAVESLVMESHVVAVLGPLFSGEALAAAEKAEELGVPLLCLSHREGLHEVGPFVFRTALTVRAQAEALAQTAFDDLHMTKFAILYPKTRYGVDFMTAFWDAVDRRHGEIRGVEAYTVDQTTFREPVRRLIGRWFMNARPEYKETLKSLKEQELPPMRLRGEIAKLDKRMAPIVDFEGLIVPDSGRQLGLIAPAIAFEDVPLSHDTRALERLGRMTGQNKLTPLTLLGGSTLNSAQTPESCDQYCEDAVFVDAFFGGSTNLAVRDFVSKFRDLTGTDPFLSEAQAYDTAGLVAQVLAQKTVTTRQGLHDALLSLESFRGVTGAMRFDEGGELQKKLTVLTIRGRRIVELRTGSDVSRR